MSFDESNLVPNAGLLLAAALAQRLDLAGLVEARLTVDRYGANSGTKTLTVIGAMLAGGTASTTPRCCSPGQRCGVRADPGDAIPEQAWTPIPYWLSTPEVSGAHVVETTYVGIRAT